MENQALEMFDNTIKYCNKDIFVKPVCDFFKIDYENQCKKINSSHLLKTSQGKKKDVMLFGDKKERVTLQKEGFITWILTINPQIVQVTLREKLVIYQSLIFKYFFSSIEREQNIKIKYARLKKLKKLKFKINSEIKICEDAIEDYLSNKFSQTKLDFNETKKIN